MALAPQVREEILLAQARLEEDNEYIETELERLAHAVTVSRAAALSESLQRVIGALTRAANGREDSAAGETEAENAGSQENRMAEGRGG